MRDLQMIKINEIVKITSISKTTIYRLMKLNRFPKSRKLGLRAVGWVRYEVEDWLQSCVRYKNKSGD